MVAESRKPYLFGTPGPDCKKKTAPTINDIYIQAALRAVLLYSHQYARTHSDLERGHGKRVIVVVPDGGEEVIQKGVLILVHGGHDGRKVAVNALQRATRHGFASAGAPSSEPRARFKQGLRN